MTTIVNSQMSSLLKGEISSKCSEKWPMVCDSSSDGSVYVHIGGVHIHVYETEAISKTTTTNLISDVTFEVIEIM